METALILLSGAIAKAVFKTWFSDDDFVGSAGSSIVDIVTKVVPDKRAKSAAIRQMDRIAEMATDVIEPYLGFEHLGLSNEQIESTTKRVAEAIEVSGLNARILAEMDFDAPKLAEMISENLSNPVSENDIPQLCQELLATSAEMIVDLSSSLPNFERESYAEILKREAKIIERLDSVFLELNQFARNISSDRHEGAKLFEKAYLRSVSRKLDQVELFGLDTGSKSNSRQHSLSTAYISLSVSKSVDSDNDGVDDAFTVRAEKAAQLSRLVVVKGEAGSGKTTLLQSLAVRSSNGSFVEEMEDWNSLVPFFLRLRALTESQLPRPEELPQLVAPAISGTMPKDWVHEQLADGRGLILIDGLDEVSSDLRKETREWIVEILSAFPESRIVVTTRPPAVPDKWLLDQGFAELELLPMSPDDVESFIEHWHDAVVYNEVDASKLELAMALVQPLKNRIKADKTLSELAATPLLCAMLCAMNRDRHEVLPSNRIALYEAAVQMLIHARDEQRRIIVDDLPSLDFETKSGLLQEIAFWMMQNGWSMVERWRLEEFVAGKMQNFTRVPEAASAIEVVDILLLRSGLIRSPIEGKIDFIHNAFKEFLCAKACVSSDRFGFLEKQLGNEAWREVAVLAAAMTDDVRRSEFIGNILRYGDESTSKRSMYHLLAVQCLETCTQLNQGVQDEIRTRLKSLKAPTNVSEARSLSSAGELAIPLLNKESGQYARTSASCVRALRLIGTENALKTLEQFGSDKRATVVKELIAAWPYFNITEYAERVLSKSTGINNQLFLSESKYLDAAGHLGRIKRLRLRTQRHQISQMQYSNLNQLSQLEELSVLRSEQFNIGNIDLLVKLKSLIVVSDSILGTERLKDFSDLQNLTLHSASKIDLQGLQELENLTHLNIRSEGIFVEKDLFTNSRLKVLRLGNIDNENLSKILKEQNDIVDLSYSSDEPAEAFRQVSSKVIEFLELGNGAGIESLDPLDGQNNLHSLTIRKARDLEDISKLRELGSIRSVVFYGAENLMDLKPLSDLADIRNVVLDCSESANFEALLNLEANNVRISVSEKCFSAAQAAGLSAVRKSRYAPYMTRIRIF